MNSTRINRRLRLAMVGGGEGAYIGGIHRYASRLDDQYELVAGAFDISAEKGRAFAGSVGVASNRAYGSYLELIESERARADKADIVSICTPNHTHFPIAKALIEAGFDIICEKPMTTTLEDAVSLHQLARSSGCFVGVTYTYSGYPLVHEARALVAQGVIGTVRVVQVEYPLEWMATAIEAAGNAQAEWRTDPKRSGRGGSIGDIGTHAYHLAAFVSGLKLDALCADLATFVPGRSLDDNAHVMLRYEGGARGLLWSSQVAIAHSNGLRLRITGDKGSLAWAQEQPNELLHTSLGGAPVTIKRGRDDVSEAARVRTRTPPGHPEGYIEAFANLYGGFAEAIRAQRDNRQAGPLGRDIPVTYDGLKGVAFVDAVVDSFERGSVWVKPEFV
ncbi:oxidoreductase domain-containing protein [Caballeronia udeis]|uniref:Oxidoreductase domain-containing protein n=1 Tax=Caballeronia udeis TaxID=1232866 RepID=A0A158IB51_9BURK|nr:Gfo/Idh/MocA family oxidoreductase [Caballeronia udeis]SAL53361.1 oxidoreductase domain-containing protein [Caballeronia udeis]